MAESLFGLYKEWHGVDPTVELPATLAAHREHTDGLAHCPKCGGVAFTSTVVFTADGTPAQVLSPQKCIGCGELRKANWPS